jgi:hypothetical protein
MPPVQKEANMNINSANNETGDATMSEVTVVDIRHLSTAQLAQLGVSQIAYVRPATVNGEPAFAIHAADGTPMAVANNQEVALAAIRQYDMIPALVH